MRSLWFEHSAVATDDPAETLNASSTYDDVVVGAGLSGLVTAVLLARAGRAVIVLEARHIGAGATGNTTGKVSLLQGTKLSRLMRTQSEKVCRAYLDANREGQAWLLRFCEDHDIAYDTRDAVTYAADDRETAAAHAEFTAADRLGLEVRWTDDLDVPFPQHGAVVLRDQAQIDPMAVLAGLAEEFRAHGGRIVEGARVVSATFGQRPVARLRGGASIAGHNLILATGTPILDRGLYFAKLEANRSYALAFAHPDPPAAMYLSAGSPTTSVRDAARPDGSRLLLTGGFGHPVGRGGSETEHLDALREWTVRHFPQARETNAWAAQDYSSHDGVPYLGPLPRGRGHIFVLTGYDKWGMTNAVAGGLDIAARILGGNLPWARALGRRVTGPRAALQLARTNLAVGLSAVDSIIGTLLHPRSPSPSITGNGSSTAASSPDPACALVPVCTHLGGRLRWNDAERSWDCPLHGSRFDEDGEVIEGPATRRLVGRPAAPQVSGTTTP